MKRLGLLRFIPLWPVILLVVFALVWNQRLSIATWILDQVVIGEEIENLSVTPQRLELDRSMIASMQFNASVEDRKYQIDAENVEITYRFKDIKSLALEHVKLDRLKILPIDLHGAASEQGTEKPTIKQLISTIDQLQKLELPFESFTVQHLELSLPEFALTISDGTIALTAQDKRWELNITDGPRNIALAGAPDKLVLKLGSTQDRTSNVVQLEALARSSDKSMEITTKLDTRALGGWIQHYPITAPFARALQLFEARPSIALRLSPIDEGHLMNVRAEADQFEIGEFTASEFRVRSDFIVDNRIFDKPIHRIGFNKGAEVFASKMDFDVLSATDLKFEPVGYLDFSTENIIATLTAGSKLSAPDLRYEDISIQSFSAEPVMTLKNSTVQIAADSRVRAKQINIPDLMLSNIDLLSKKPSVLRLDPDNDFEHRDGSWTLESDFRLDESNRVSGIFEIDISHLSTESFKSRISSDKPKISLDIELPSIETITMEITSAKQRLEASGTLVLEKLDNSMEFSISNDFETSLGTGRIWNQSPLTATELVNLAQSIQMEMPDTLIVEDGGGDVALSGTWTQDELTLVTDFALTGLSGLYQEAQFRNMAVAGSVQILPKLQSQEKILAEVGSLEYGVVLTDLTSEFMLSTTPKGDLPKLHFDNIYGELFSSSFAAEDFSIDLNDPDTTLNLRVQNLDIEQVVATQGIEGLEATGRVDGNLPVTISSRGISIEDGIFWNHLGGGNIVYTISDEQAAALDNPLTDVVITALRDFRYRVLTAETNYHPNGDLYMNFHLEGISPQLDPDRPVHLNINSEQNVLSLLKSLSYSEGVSKALDKQIQEKFE